MRIIGGEYRSRLIKMPGVTGVRPTQDKVRGAVFNMSGDLIGKRVLDLFAGSGAYGIEAISRGAARSIFVDDDPRCIDVIKENLESLKIDPSRYGMIRSDALRVFPKLERDNISFDLIFMDPPYRKDMAKKCLINICSCDILARSGLVIVEHFKKDVLEADPDAVILEKERRYGDTVVSIFRRNPAPSTQGPF